MKFAKNENGNTAMIFALCLIGIAALVGLVIDFSRAQNTRDSLQGAADAAALAVARDPDVTSANLQQRTSDFFNANMQSQSFGVKYTIKARELPGGQGIRVEAQAKVDTTFAALAGIDHFQINTVAEVLHSTNKIELVMALDNTGSMGDHKKIKTLRKAANALVDQLIPDNNTEENVKIGIAPFNYMVRLPTTMKNENWLIFDYVTKNKWKGCVAPRKPPHNVKDSAPNSTSKKFQALPGGECPKQQITALTNDKVALHKTINKMEANNWTYIAEGLSWAWRIVSKRAPIKDGTPYDDEDWTKILILMTDGANTVRWAWPGNDPEATKDAPSTQGDTATKKLCTAIKAKGILIYTIAFDIGDTDTKKMMQNCASTKNMYYDASNNAQLSIAFAKIAGDINNLRLSK